jgi:hypothetical protein
MALSSNASGWLESSIGLLENLPTTLSAFETEVPGASS